MSKTFKHLMLDIETMGEGSYSSIVSIGALEFDIETGETGKEFYLNIDLQSCLDLGLTVSGSTIMWWLNQNKQARKDLTKFKPVSIQKALLEFTKFCKKDYQVWGNSARFDCGILGNAFERVGMPIPWDFRKERCVRTLVSFKPEIKESYSYNGTAHNALSDCYSQVGYCSEIWKSVFVQEEPRTVISKGNEWLTKKEVSQQFMHALIKFISEGGDIPDGKGLTSIICKDGVPEYDVIIRRSKI